MLACDAIHVLPYQIEHFLGIATLHPVGLLPLQLPYQFLFENETSVEQCLLIHHQRLANTRPHIVLSLFVEVAVEDIPTFHECCILRKQGILHVLEVVLAHLEVHLVLE